MGWVKLYDPVEKRQKLPEGAFERALRARWGDAMAPANAVNRDMMAEDNTEIDEDQLPEYWKWSSVNKLYLEKHHYDTQGLWLAIKNGEVEWTPGGALPERFKKRNHPTFSTQSQYSGKDGNVGGTWNEDGSFTPAYIYNEADSEYLKEYFEKHHPGAKLNLEGRVSKDTGRPELIRAPGQPGLLDGDWGTLKDGLFGGGMQTGSNLMTLGSWLGVDRIAPAKKRETWPEQQQRTALQAAADLRKYVREHYEPDPETTGGFWQVMYGLSNVIPRAAAYSAFGPWAGAALTAADLSLYERETLGDKGVDDATRNAAFVWSFLANLIGFRAPAAFGSAAWKSALYGAGVNVGTDSAERLGIQGILQWSGYEELADEYQITPASLAVSAALGGFFGRVGWEDPAVREKRKVWSRIYSEVEPRARELYPQMLSIFNDMGFPAERAEGTARIMARKMAAGEFLLSRKDQPEFRIISEEVEELLRNTGLSGKEELSLGVEGGLAPQSPVGIDFRPEATHDPAKVEQVADSHAGEKLKAWESGPDASADRESIRSWLESDLGRKVIEAEGGDWAGLFSRTRILERSMDHKSGEAEFRLGRLVQVGPKLYSVVFRAYGKADPKTGEPGKLSIRGMDVFYKGERALPAEGQAAVGTMADLVGGEYRRRDGKGFFDDIDDSAFYGTGPYSDGKDFELAQQVSTRTPNGKGEDPLGDKPLHVGIENVRASLPDEIKKYRTLPTVKKLEGESTRDHKARKKKKAKEWNDNQETREKEEEDEFQEAYKKWEKYRDVTFPQEMEKYEKAHRKWIKGGKKGPEPQKPESPAKKFPAKPRAGWAMKSIDALRVTLGTGSKETDYEKALEEIIGHMVDNLLFLYKKVLPKVAEKAMQWYIGGADLCQQWSHKFMAPLNAVCGVVAAYSPQKDWFMNMSLAERTLDIFYGTDPKTGELIRDHVWDDKMSLTADDHKDPVTGKKVDGIADGREDAARAKGKSLSQLLADQDYDAAAVWLRVYDETYHDRGYAILDPKGNVYGKVKADNGTDAKVAWQSYSNIAKTISILDDPRFENIHLALGDKHKIRNFYNNLRDPTDKLSVTIDTHAVAAALWRPLASSDTEVDQNFGRTGSQSVLGVNGTYAILAEAYRRVAAILTEEARRIDPNAQEILPREVQSVTWEAIRALFKASWKTIGNKLAVDRIWEDFRDGKLYRDRDWSHVREPVLDSEGKPGPGIEVVTKREDVLEMIYRLAGQKEDHINPEDFAWNAKGVEGERLRRENENRLRKEQGLPPITDTYDRDTIEPWLIGSALKKAGRGFITIEVAPDPDNIELAQRWDSLSREEQKRITEKILYGDEEQESLLEKAFQKFGLEKGTYHLSLEYGGFEGKPNLSLRIDIDDVQAGPRLAAYLGHVFNQKSVMFLTDTNVVGSNKGTAVTLKFRKTMTAEQLGDKYKKWYELLGQNTETGKKFHYVDGFSVEKAGDDIVVTILSEDQTTAAKILEKLREADPDIRALSKDDAFASTVYFGFPDKKTYFFLSKEEAEYVKGWEKKRSAAESKLRKAEKNLKDATGELDKAIHAAAGADTIQKKELAVAKSRKELEEVKADTKKTVAEANRALEPWKKYREDKDANYLRAEEAAALDRELSLAERRKISGTQRGVPEQPGRQRGEGEGQEGSVGLQEGERQEPSGMEGNRGGAEDSLGVRSTGDIVGGERGEKTEGAVRTNQGGVSENNGEARPALRGDGQAGRGGEKAGGGNKGGDELAQRGAGGRKGFYSPVTNTLTFVKGRADVSTVLHENAHHWLTLLMKEGRNSPYGFIRADIEALLKYWKIGDENATFEQRLAAWDKLGLEGQRRYQEQFASIVEIVVSEGQLPARGLTGVFQRFAAWMRIVYHDMVGKEVGDRYQSEFGTSLGEATPEFRDAVGHMFAIQDASAGPGPQIPQYAVAAARAVQTERTTEQKTNAPLANPKDPVSLSAGRKALTKAVEDINSGRPVDVSEAVGEQPANEQFIEAGEKILAEAYASEGGSIESSGEGSGEAVGKVPVNEPESVAQAREQRSMEMFGDSADAARVANIMEDMPDMSFGWKDDEGKWTELRIDQVTELAEAIDRRAELDAAGIGKLAECVIRNRGAG